MKKLALSILFLGLVCLGLVAYLLPLAFAELDIEPLPDVEISYFAGTADIILIIILFFSGFISFFKGLFDFLRSL